MNKDELALELANEMRDTNNEVASEIYEDVISMIDFDKYKEDKKTSVLVYVQVRHGTDVYSCGGAYGMKTSGRHDAIDVHKSMMNINKLGKDVLDEME